MLAANAETLRSFTESLSSRFPDLRKASEKLGVSGGSCVDASAFEQSLRMNFGYSSSAAIARIFKLLVVHHTGVISEFEIAQLFTAPALLRSLERQLKGKISSPFVAFRRFRPTGEGSIDVTDFKDVLEQLLGYSDATLMETLFDGMDLDGDGYISFSEFVIFWNGGYPAPYGFYEPLSNREATQSTMEFNLPPLPPSNREITQSTLWIPGPGSQVSRDSSADSGWSDSRSCSPNRIDWGGSSPQSDASTRASTSCRSQTCLQRSDSAGSDRRSGARRSVDRRRAWAGPKSRAFEA